MQTDMPQNGAWGECIVNRSPPYFGTMPQKYSMQQHRYGKIRSNLDRMWFSAYYIDIFIYFYIL